MFRSRLFTFHVIPFFIASILSFFVLQSGSINKYFFSYDNADTSVHIPDTSQRFNTNYSEGYRSRLTIQNALNNGNQIVVIGSSEMTETTMEAIPYNFLNSKNIPCIGFGHSGNQLLSIATQLASMHNDIKRSKLVIILSPGWFESGERTPIESFLEYNNEHALNIIWNDSTIPAEFKDHLSGYIENQFKNINSPSSVIKAMYYSGIAQKSPLHKIICLPGIQAYDTYVKYKQNRMQNLYSMGLSEYPFADIRYKPLQFQSLKALSNQINFDSLKNDAIEKFKPTCANNPFGIDSNYYNQWMKGKGLRKIKPINPESNEEFDDLVILLKLLKHYDCSALFVMQPLNPLPYENMDDLTPMLNKIETEIKTQGFDYLNLHEPDKNKYIIGAMKDFQHMNNYSWYTIDEKIIELFADPNNDDKAIN